MKFAKRAVFACLTCSICGLFAAALSADAPREKPVPKNSAFEAISGLTGTWVAVGAPEGQKPMTLVFKPTAGGSAILETRAPGSDHEMVNLYSIDGSGVLLTHYCHLGNQPRMRATAAENGVLQFDYVDAGNLKSRDEAHMDSVTMTIKGNQLIEDWAMYEGGKITGHHSFEFKRQ
jgi:hypothetical protein